MSILVGVTGSLGVGKSTVAHLLSLELASLLPMGSFVRTPAFADAIKKAAQQVFALDDNWLDDDAKNIVHPDWGITPRQMYVGVGEGLKAPFGVDLWVKRMQHERLRNPNDALLLGDVRNIRGLDLEAIWIRSQGGQIIHVDGPQRREQPEFLNGDATEAFPVAFKDGDHRINNVGSILGLRQAVQVLAKEIMEAQQ